MKPFLKPQTRLLARGKALTGGGDLKALAALVLRFDSARYRRAKPSRRALRSKSPSTQVLL
jgi:hypothetical protein